jgi:antagonist of KipI
MTERAIESDRTGRIRVVAAGPQSLVQDGGRTGFQKLGVSVSGAADIDALVIGNRLVNNDFYDAAVEILLGGAEFEFETAVNFALTGAETGATLDGVPLARNVSYSAHASARLVLGMPAPGQGLRTYLAVAGGVTTPSMLGSRSTHVASEIGGVGGRALEPGDVLEIGVILTPAVSGKMFNSSDTPANDSELPAVNVRVVLGPQDDEFSAAGIRTFLDSTYVVTDQSNRQGLRLDGPVIESLTGSYDIVSDAVVNGSVQVPGDGNPIVLLADRQPTGGYAKIATVITVDLPKLGQAAPGTKITFVAISVEESQQLLRERSTRLLKSELGQAVDTFSVQVNDLHVSIGVTEGEAGRRDLITRIARINDVAYPISAVKYTSAE